MCRWIKKSQDRFLSGDRRIDRLELSFCSSILFLCRLEVDHWQPTATRHFNAQQICCCSSCLLLLLSSRAGLIQINLLIICLHLRCPHGKIAVATALRPRACAQGYCSDHAPARKQTRASKWAGRQEQGAICQNTCRYMQIRPNTYCTYEILTCQYVILTCQYHIRTETTTTSETYPVHVCVRILYVCARIFQLIRSDTSVRI